MPINCSNVKCPFCIKGLSHVMLNLRCFSQRGFHQHLSITILAILIGFQVGGRRGRKKPCYEPETFLICWQVSPSPFSCVVVYPLVWVLHTWSLVLEIPDWLFTDKWKLWMPMVWLPFTDAPLWKNFCLFSSLPKRHRTWTSFWKDVF